MAFLMKSRDLCAWTTNHQTHKPSPLLWFIVGKCSGLSKVLIVDFKLNNLNNHFYSKIVIFEHIKWMIIPHLCWFYIKIWGLNVLMFLIFLLLNHNPSSFTFLNYILNALFSILLTSLFSLFNKSMYLNIRYWHRLLFIY